MKVRANIDYALYKAWEVWAVEVDVPDEIVALGDEAVIVHIESGFADIDFVTMKDSGNTSMEITAVELT